MKPAPRATLDDLEVVEQPEPESLSVLSATLRRHRRTPIEQLGPDALRFLLEEGEGVSTVLGVALDRLEQDPFLSGDFHPGDLLAAVLHRSSTVWNSLPELRARAHALVEDAERELHRLERADRAVVERAIRGFRNLWQRWS